ncbi:MAG: hypothetical protein ACOYYU_14580 [Chloroflexota bacterium]
MRSLKLKQVLSAVLFLLAGCGHVVPAVETQTLDVYATPAAQPWLADVYACAPEGIALRVVDSPDQADLAIRLGEPDLWPAPVYRIGSEEILVAAHPASPLQDLTLEAARALFAGAGDPSVEMWVYAGEEDVQGVFEQAVMAGRPVTSLARLAAGPQHMSDVLSETPNAVGLLPRRWKVGDLHVAYTIPNVPVLALVNDEPQGALRALLACLQP